MKVVALLTVIFALFQVGKSDPSRLAAEISRVLTQCANNQNLDMETITTLMNELAIPEDNDDYNEFFGCFMTSFLTMDSDGNVVKGRLKKIIQEMLVQKLGDIPDVRAKAEHIVSVPYENCKNIPKGTCVGQTAIKIINCIKAQIQRTQTH